MPSFFSSDTPFDLVLRDAQVVTPAGVEELDIGVQDGCITALGDLKQARASRLLSFAGCHILPGVIDSQVHFREPGLEHKEDLHTGTAAAALGGVTAIMEMPNTRPNTDSAAALADKLTRARGRAWVHHAFFIGATPENARLLGELEGLPGAAGVKVFMGSSTGSLLIRERSLLREVLRHGQRRVAIHAEDEARLVARRPMVEAADAKVQLHPEWRDTQSALLATETLLSEARAAGRRVHVLHISTADELPRLAAHRDVATVECTPQHLTLAAPDCYDALGSLAQMNPPIRGAEHRAALWQAVATGLIDVVGSDHAPHTREEKAQPYPKSPSGMPGVQTLLPLMLEHLHQGRLSLLRLVDLLAAGPARVYGLAGKGRIALGYDADFTVVDLARTAKIRNEDQASRSGWTPFDGKPVHGWPIATILDGRVVMRDGELVGAPAGRPLSFVDTLPAS